MVFVCHLNTHVQVQPLDKKGIFSQGLKGINGVLSEINYKGFQKLRSENAFQSNSFSATLT